MDVDIIENRASMLSDQNDCSDFTCKDTDEIDNGYSRVERENKIDNKNQKVNTKKLFEQLSNSRVVLKRLPDSIISQKLQPTKSSNLIRRVAGTPVIHPTKLKTPRTRYCSKCKVVVPNSDKYSPNTTCTKCGNPLHFQCVQCYSVFTYYNTLFQHLMRNRCKIAKVDSNSKNKLRPPIEMMKRYCSKCKAVDPNFNDSTRKLCTKCEDPLHFQCVQCYSVFTHYISFYRHLVRNSCRNAKVDSDSENKLKPVEMMKRYCSKCKAVDPNFNDSTGKLCTKCGDPLHFQCVQCYSVFTIYNSFYHHLVRNSCRNAEVDPDSKHKQKHIEMMKRYCSKCKAVDPNINVSTKKCCTKCGDPLHFQCVYCYKVYPLYKSTSRHLRMSCRVNKRSARKSNIRHKCNKCNFEAIFKQSLKRHYILVHTLDGDTNSTMMTRYSKKYEVVESNSNISSVKPCKK